MNAVFSKGLGEGGASSPLRRPQKWRRPIFLRPRALRRLQRRSPPPSEPDSEPPRPVDYACVRDSCTDACSACDRIDVFRPARPGPALPACELGVPRAAARKQKAAAEAPAAPRPKRGQRDPAAGEDAVAQRLAVAAATQQQKAEKKAAAELALAACRSAAAATKLQKEMAAAARQAAAEKKAVAGWCLGNVTQMVKQAEAQAKRSAAARKSDKVKASRAEAAEHKACEKLGLACARAAIAEALDTYRCSAPSSRPRVTADAFARRSSIPEVRPSACVLYV